MKVKVFKNGQECGWFKDVIPGVNAIIMTCVNLGFDITQYHFTEYDNTENIVWRGEKNMLEMQESV